MVWTLPSPYSIFEGSRISLRDDLATSLVFLVAILIVQIKKLHVRVTCGIFPFTLILDADEGCNLSVYVLEIFFV